MGTRSGAGLDLRARAVSGLLIQNPRALLLRAPQLAPGAHAVLIGDLDGALEGRRMGLVLRDTLLMVLPGGVSLGAFLFRKPLDGPSVVGNLLKHGEGVLNVPVCRATADASAWHPTAPKGRFPANVLLVHANSCRQVGSRRVHSGKTPEVLGERVSGLYNLGTERKLASAWMSKCYGDEDGMETLAQWECAPGCPAYEVDQGEGNSRYHLQFACVANAIEWLEYLVGCMS
jgi:hypothetical protein